MTVLLEQIVDRDLLNQYIADGLVRVAKHPDDENLVIYCYTPKAVSGEWTPTLKACRGLIVRHVSETEAHVVARGPNKFFNVTEPQGQEVVDAMTGLEEVILYDKVDGSLGICYPAPDGRWAVATKGSFTSPQALHATAILRERYEGWLNRPWSESIYAVATGAHPFLTPIVEIVYPENRIVVDYKDQDDLIFLGATIPEQGYLHTPIPGEEDNWWPGLCAEVLYHGVANYGPNDVFDRGAEGLVMHVRLDNNWHMVKIKEEWYVKLHRIATGLDERTVWEHVSGYKDGHFGEPRDIGDLIKDLDAEHQGWAIDVAAWLYLRYHHISAEIHRLRWAADQRAHYKAVDRDGGLPNKKDLIEEAKAGPRFNQVANLISGASNNKSIWREIKPPARAYAGWPVRSEAE